MEEQGRWKTELHHPLEGLKSKKRYVIEKRILSQKRASLREIGNLLALGGKGWAERNPGAQEIEKKLAGGRFLESICQSLVDFHEAGVHEFLRFRRCRNE